MERIPVGDGRSAADNLVQASRDEIALDGKAPIVVPAWFPRTLADVRVMLSDPKLIAELDLTPDDEEEFATRVWQLMTSSRERAVQEYERLPWSTYLGSKHQSEAFRRFLVGRAHPHARGRHPGGGEHRGRRNRAHGARLRHRSARAPSDDRLLCGPTNDVWLTPWLAHLRGAGVDYHLNAEVTAIHCDGERITGVTVRRGRHGVRRDRRPLRRRRARGADGTARLEGHAGRGSDPARHHDAGRRRGVDDRDPDLPVRASPHRGRPRDLHRDARGP